jgi:hypothetical protein
MPVQRSAPEFDALLLPHLSMPKRSPQGNRGSSRGFHLILWRLYTGRQWQGVPVPTNSTGNPAIHDTPLYTVLARWADDGSLWQALSASVAPLAAEKRRDLRVLQGHETNTVAPKGARALASRGTNRRRASKASPASTSLALSALPSPWRPSMQRIWGCSLMGYKRGNA